MADDDDSSGWRRAMEEFRRLLVDLAKQFGGTKQELARRAGLSPSAFSRLHAGRSVPSVEVCLRLAIVTSTSASKLLRAAGKGTTADLLEDLYGAAAIRRHAFVGVRHLNPTEQRHMEAVRALAPKDQRAFFYLVERASAQRMNGGKTLPFDAARQ